MIKIVLGLSVLGLAQAWSGARSVVSCGTHTMAVGETLTIESENHPSKYPKDHSCSWDITCDDPKSQIEFECSKFQLQNSNGCKKDYLKISDSTGTITKACRKDVPSGITTASNTLSLNFITNGDTIRKPGFTCDATCVNHCKAAETTAAETTAAETTAAETTAAETTATETTAAETTAAETTAAETTAAETTVAETTAAETTAADTTAAETTAAKTTAVETTAAETTAAETTAAATTADVTTAAETTAAESTAAETTVAPADCGSHTISPGETISVQSDRHPLKYPANQECSWDITCSETNSQIEFECSKFELQNSNGCKKDYLEISDSTGTITKACRKDVPSGIVTASNTLSLNFVTNGDTTRKPGFSCDATCIVSATTEGSHCGSHTTA